MLVAQREHHRQESVPKRCTREALSCESLVYYDKYVSILCSTNVNSLHVNARLKSWASSSKRHSRAQRAGKTRKYSLKTQNSANTRHRSMEMGSLLMINSLDLWSDLPHAANRRGEQTGVRTSINWRKHKFVFCAGMQLEWNLDDDQQLISVCRTCMDLISWKRLNSCSSFLFYFPMFVFSDIKGSLSW